MDLPLWNGHYSILIIFDRLSKHCRFLPCFMEEGALSASLVATLFFGNIVRISGVLAEVSDRELRLTAPFW